MDLSDSLTKSWSNVVTLGCLIIVAIVEAWQEAASSVPISVKMPRLDGWWHYVPLALISIAGITWLMGHLRKEPDSQSLAKSADIGGGASEAAELYADTVFYWLKTHIHTAGTVSAVGVAELTGLSEDVVRRGLELLRSKYKIVSQRSPDVDSWSYIAAASMVFTPRYHIGVVAREQAIRNPLEDSQVLGSLPVYGQELEIEILCVQRGVGYLDMAGETVFLQLRLFSSIDMGFRGMKLGLSLAGNNHECEPITELSDWFLIAQSGRQAPYSAYEFTDMDTVSLWKQIQEQGLKAGLHKTGWVAIRVNELCHDIVAELACIKMSIDRAGSTILYRFVFREWKARRDEILSRQMREYRFGN